MNLLSVPRQPFVGLALIASIGITLADFLPFSSLVLLWILAIVAIIVKGQHHSGQSGSDAFLDAVQPRLIVATSRDFPGHERVSDEWAAGVRAKGIKLFRQDETGAIELRFTLEQWEAQAYVTGEVFRSNKR
jgi:hypothetical protein